jgi:AraC family transcriptional regulator
MRTVTLQDYKRRLLRVLVHIQQHLDDALPLEELAALACFSPCHFHRIFTGMVGESVKEHVRRLRLERAASRLKLTGAPVTEIAFDAGYESHEAFTRSFHSVFGVSPSRFRSSNKPGGLPPVPSRLRYAEGQAVGRFKINQTKGRKMNVKLEHKEPIRVAFMRHVGAYAQVGATWDKLLPVLGKEGLLGGDSLFIGICHDDPEVTPEDKIRYDACVTVPETFTPERGAGDSGRGLRGDDPLRALQQAGADLCRIARPMAAAKRARAAGQPVLRGVLERSPKHRAGGFAHRHLCSASGGSE